MYITTKRFRSQFKTKTLNMEVSKNTPVTIDITVKAASTANNDVIVQEDVWRGVEGIVKTWHDKVFYNGKDGNPPDKSHAMLVMGNPTPERLANLMYTRIVPIMAGLSFSVTVSFEDSTWAFLASGTYNDEKFLAV